MSDCNRPSCSRLRRGTLLRDVKPRHVRSLNFGQSILELDAVERRSVPSRVLVTDENVARIPCTQKSDYVRKWLETHENGGCDPSRSSPVLGTSATTVSQRSPILSKGRKRPRGKIRINRNATAKRLSDADRQESVERSANCTIRSHCTEKNVKWECVNEAQQTPPSVERVADETSPVLGVTSHRVFKKKKRRLQYEPKDRVPPKCSHEITNVKSVMEPDGTRNNLRRMSANQDKSEENLDTKELTRTLVFSTEVRGSPEKYQGYIEAFSSPTQEKLSFADSSSNNADKNDSRIETGTSNGSKDEECDKLTSTHSSSNNLSNFIEDTDTQETIKIPQLTDKNLIPSGQQLGTSQLIIDDLNETYCSEVEIMQNQSTRLSARISEMPSLNKTTQKTGSKSTQTDLIVSTITTPSKKSPDRSMYARLLDSGKKRRKPKKGSMVARLQSLVNAQVSGIRIWRHRMNKEQDATRYISVLLRDSTKQFGNQFLEGVLIEDRYNLLQSDIQIEQSEADVQTQPKEVIYRNITIMLVCDIIGTLKMISEVVINVYPPWNILDKDDLTLEVLYINISNNCEIPDLENPRKSHKKRILKEFNCPCIEEQRELPFCARKPSSDKPDVMQQIFNF